jgi:hypothetical protein
MRLSKACNATKIREVILVQVTVHSKNPSIPIFAVSGWGTGDTIALSDLTPPHNTFTPVNQGPGIAAWAWTYEDKQYGYGYFQVDDNGSGKLLYQFTNAKMWDGDTFTAACVLSDSSRTPLYAESVQRGVNARSEGWVEVPIVHDKAWWDQIKYITFYFGRAQKEDDQANWNVALEVVKSILESLNGGSDPQPAPEPNTGISAGPATLSPSVPYFAEGGKQIY